MPGFQIPGENTGNGEAFLGRIQFDTRVGFWKIVKRVQFADGSWGDEPSEPFKNPTLLCDFGTITAGYISFSSPPQFLLVPYGQPYPQQPTEMKTDEAGKQRKAFQAGFRIQVANPRLFGDAEPYHFAHNAATVMAPMGELLDQVMAAPEFAAGKIPLVAVTGNTTREFGNRGAKFYAPVFEIRGWHNRPDYFGERTVFPPAGGQPAAPPVAPAPRPPAPTAAAARPPNGNGAQARPAPARTPAPASAPAMEEPMWDDARMTPPAREPGGGAKPGNFDSLDDEIPFAKQWQ